MRLGDNFYYWASWFLLGVFLLLVFYFYQVEYSFENFIDVKTILLVLGTLGGAFLGAKFAGQKTLESINQQIEYDRSKSEKEEKERLEKIFPLLKRHVLSLKAHLDQFLFLIRENESGFTVYEIDFQKEITYQFNKIIEVKKSLDKIRPELISIEMNDNIQKMMYQIVKVDSVLDIY